MASEKNFENKIKKYLKDNGAWFIKYWAGAQFTKSGVPDILACIDGYFIAIEVKAQNGKPSELQLYNIREIRKAGGFAWVVYPSGFNKLKVQIDGIRIDNFNKEGEMILKLVTSKRRFFTN